MVKCPYCKKSFEPEEIQVDLVTKTIGQGLKKRGVAFKVLSCPKCNTILQLPRWGIT